MHSKTSRRGVKERRRGKAWAGVTAAAWLLVAPALAAQRVVVPDTHPRVRAALDVLRTDNGWTLDQQASLCEIPAPPFGEAVRAAEYRRRLEQLGVRDARIDAEGNVIARRPGTGGGETVLLSAHLDTVFPEGTDVSVTREGTTLRGPGIGDDCRGLAVVLAVARALERAQLRTRGDLLLVGTVGEEGPGNLRGVRHLFEKELPGQVRYFLSVDGTGLGLTTAAVGSYRYRVTYRGPGGHSYGAFGMPNPIHALGRAIAQIAELPVPERPRTTFNVGVIQGGTSVNSISATGVMDVDMRSESPAVLDTLDGRVRRALEIDTIGIRPAGSQPDSAHIVRAALAAGQALGFTSPTAASSTDANIPISLGIPAITIDGGGEGRGAHSLGESYDDGDRGWLGPQWALLIVVMLAGLN